MHSAEVRVSCGVRGCPGCERRSAAERAARVSGAALRVSELVAHRARAAAAQLATDLDAARSSRDRWAQLAASARARHEARGRVRDLDAAEGHALRAARAEVRRARLRRWTTEAQQAHTWRWRLVTVSPPWDPRRGDAYSVAGLRARLADLRARCETVWSHALAVGGLAGATLRVELSALGHVHAHVLYYGPFQHAKHLSRLAGCHVDVRELRAQGDDLRAMRRAVVEATKYALKAPSGLRQQWVAGESWRVVHPELAAAWIVATRDQQLVTHRGTMRDAIAAELACAPPTPADGPAELKCARCHAPVCPIGEVWDIARVARELPVAWWRERVKLIAFRL